MFIAAFIVAIFSAQAQQTESDSASFNTPTVQPDTASGEADAGGFQADTLGIDGDNEVDTTSTRTFGTSPGTGTTGAGSGNGDAAGNTGIPGSATMEEPNNENDTTDSRGNSNTE